MGGGGAVGVGGWGGEKRQKESLSFPSEREEDGHREKNTQRRT